MKPQEQMIKEFQEELKVAKEQEEKERILDLMGRYEGPDEVVPMSEVVKKAKRRTTTLREYFTGISGLDDILTSLRDTELVTIAGPTKNGKTTLAMTITAGLINDGFKPHWFSYEMTELEFEEKMGEKYMEGIFTPMELKTNDIDWVEAKIMESIRKYESQVFFIDHLHYVCDISGKANENMSIRIGNTVRRLKLMARKWGVVIVLLAHTTKIPATSEPTTSAIRDSSFIAAESNTVIYVRRKGEEANYSNETEVFVIANRRNGQNGKVDVSYNHDTKMLEQVYV